MLLHRFPPAGAAQPHTPWHPAQRCHCWAQPARAPCGCSPRVCAAGTHSTTTASFQHSTVTGTPCATRGALASSMAAAAPALRPIPLPHTQHFHALLSRPSTDLQQQPCTELPAVGIQLCRQLPPLTVTQWDCPILLLAPGKRYPHHSDLIKQTAFFLCVLTASKPHSSTA